ncbi:hypothetical protein RJ639_028585 [Escallonia herrerae]|uniref:Uncharacterized protein n=1 Tax=Escallonia herrerae TaxID=1293975 RepID=A0AA89BF93_9ASTE|nr:hypothetical protein RJ639_028585 [Escallonia herrerae]
MAYSLAIPKPTCHARSNSSLPARSHPLIVSVEDHLHRLKASEVTSSSSASSLCNKLDGLKDLHESLHVQELEEGLESIFRCSVKTRVLLLNVDHVEAKALLLRGACLTPGLVRRIIPQPLHKLEFNFKKRLMHINHNQKASQEAD